MMLSENIINESCFSDEDRQNYNRYKDKIGDNLTETVNMYMDRKIHMQTALDKIHDIDFGDLNEYTVDLFFVLECTHILGKKYEAEGIGREIFRYMVEDIKYKLDECIRVKNTFGTFVVDWYPGFMELTRVALGRLQYDIIEYDGECITTYGFTLNKGDFALKCHIPSGGPLKPELCIESFKMAYGFFRDKLKNGILPILCRSWLLYPGYRNAFGESSNTVDFVKNFKMLSVHETEKFNEAWRVFGTDCDGDISKLPANTTLQRNFIKYIKAGRSFGGGTGIILYDGKKVLTRE